MSLEIRSAVKTNDCWNVECMYPTYDDWLKDFEKKFSSSDVFSPLEKFRGRLAAGAGTVKDLLDHVFQADRDLSYLYTYAHLRHDEDIAEDRHKTGFIRICSVFHEFSRAVSWIEPELLLLPQEKISEYLQADVLKEYRFHLEKILRVKNHTLSSQEESLLALSAEALDGYTKAFSALNNADLAFGSAKDSSGKEHEITHASYGVFLRDRDRTLRENAFKGMHEKFEDYENTISELLTGLVKKHLFRSKARKYTSCLEASLYPKNIDTQVYHSLVETVNSKIGVLHDYIDLREKTMNVGPLHLYDMYVPVTPEFDITMTFEEACDLIIESVAPLGEEYTQILAKGLREDRWVDRYENKGKRSGAYSNGCHDSMPYILMNYKDVLRDVFTLAHEAGHSMHSYYSRKHQPYCYSDYPIFLAEVASTFNEELLMQHMMKKAKSKEEKIYLLNMKIEDIRATLFRQTMFAEFELSIHTKAERNEPLTPANLKEEFYKLNQKYFGPKVEIDSVAKIEWARIPHFYADFYVYQYATGISAALALADRVLHGGVKERDEYLNFLKSGSSKYPVETLKIAGVDMSTGEPVTAAINRFHDLVTEMRALL